MRTLRAMVPLLTLALPSLAGCGGTRHESVDGPPPAGDSSYDLAGADSQAARTREMEEQAAELDRRYQEALADPEATEAEKIRAYQEFEAGRQKLIETGERGADEDDGGDDD